MRERREERTKEMIRQFVTLRKENKSIQEIANLFGLSKKTVYFYLQEIADSNGVSRDDLLYQVHKEYDVNYVTRKTVEHIDAVELKNHFSAMIDEANKIISTLDNILKELDEATITEEENEY